MLVCSALIREGFQKIFVTKVALWSALGSLICTQVPLIFPGLDGLDHSNTARQTPDWTVFDQAVENSIAIKTTKEHVVATEDPYDKGSAVHEDPAAKIDYMPTCGSGETRVINRFDLAKINEWSSDRRC